MTNRADSDQKQTDLDLHCLQMQGISGFSRNGLIITAWYFMKLLVQVCHFIKLLVQVDFYSEKHNYKTIKKM